MECARKPVLQHRRGSRHAAPARGRNRSGGGRSATEEDEKAELPVVDAGDDEEFPGDELAVFSGLVLDISYR
jgi:hypothetical protein